MPASPSASGVSEVEDDLITTQSPSHTADFADLVTAANQTAQALDESPELSPAPRLAAEPSQLSLSGRREEQSGDESAVSSDYSMSFDGNEGDVEVDAAPPSACTPEHSGWQASSTDRRVGKETLFTA